MIRAIKYQLCLETALLSLSFSWARCWIYFLERYYLLMIFKYIKLKQIDQRLYKILDMYAIICENPVTGNRWRDVIGELNVK